MRIIESVSRVSFPMALSMLNKIKVFGAFIRAHDMLLLLTEHLIAWQAGFNTLVCLLNAVQHNEQTRD